MANEVVRHRGALIDAGSYDGVTVRESEVGEWVLASDYDALVMAIRSLLPQWREYQRTSEAEMRRLQEEADEMFGAEVRQAEACTLNVCISMLESELAKWAVQSGSLEAAPRTEAAEK